MMVPGDKLLAILVILFGAGIIIGGWGYLLCAPLILAIIVVGLAVWAADRFFRELRIW